MSPLFSRRAPTPYEPPDELTAAPDASPPAARRGLPETSPTWELEMIISGAIVVGLFQLPGLIASLLGRAELHATVSGRMGLSVAHTYVLAAAYALIGVFTAHLAARAYWVALVGLNSVYPRGIRWQEMNAGPAALDVYRRRLRALPLTIERVDNFCSVAFSFAFMIVGMLAFSVVVMGTVGITGYLVARSFFGGRHLETIGLAIFAAWFLPTTIVAWIDRRMGKGRAAAEPAPAWLRRAMAILFRVNPAVLLGPILFTLTTNVGRKKFMAVLVGALYLVLFVSFVDQMLRRDRLALNGYDYFAMAPTRGVDWHYYESQRPDGGAIDRFPSIQSDVVADRYVKLFIPYAPARDNDAIAARCPRLAPLDSRGVHMHAAGFVADSVAAPVLACLGALHAVTLDGAALARAEFSFYEHPRTGVRGIITYIPTDSLAPGRHVLTVLPTAAPDDSAAGRPFVIPFWK